MRVALMLSLALASADLWAGPAVGQHVAAPREGAWQLAKAVTVSAERCTVEFADGLRADLPLNHLLSLPRRPSLEVGDWVFAAWDTSKLYEGVVLEVRGEGVLVAWNDGTPASMVPWGRLMRLELAERFGLGSYVAVRMPEGLVLAVIRGMGREQYEVEIPGGERTMVAKEEVLYIPAHPDLSKGERVWACGPLGGLWGEGEVKEVLDYGFMVLWKDGSGPNFVPPGRIIREATLERGSPANRPATPE